MFQALEQLGHQAFRPGQERVVMRILSGELGCRGDEAGPRPGHGVALLTLGPSRHVHAAGVAHRGWQVPVLPAPCAALRPAEPLPHAGHLSPPVSHGRPGILTGAWGPGRRQKPVPVGPLALLGCCLLPNQSCKELSCSHPVGCVNDPRPCSGPRAAGTWQLARCGSTPRRSGAGEGGHPQ